MAKGYEILLMLDKEFKYYIDNQAELVKKYKDRHIVIVGEEVVGDYESISEAYSESLKKYEAGKFLIQLCEPGEDSYTQTFHTRVVFN